MNNQFIEYEYPFVDINSSNNLITLWFSQWYISFHLLGNVEIKKFDLYLATSEVGATTILYFKNIEYDSNFDITQTFSFISNSDMTFTFNQAEVVTEVLKKLN